MTSSRMPPTPWSCMPSIWPRPRMRRCIINSSRGLPAWGPALLQLLRLLALLRCKAWSTRRSSRQYAPRRCRCCMPRRWRPSCLATRARPSPRAAISRAGSTTCAGSRRCRCRIAARCQGLADKAHMLRLVIVMAALLTALPAVAGAQQRFLTEEAAVTRILDVANERMALMPGVAATKWQTHAPVADPKREQVVIEHSGDLAPPFGLSAEPVEGVFEVQVRLAREWEETLTRQWQARGFHYTGPVPNLTQEVRPQLDTITTQMLRALYLAAPVLRRPGFAEHYARLAETHLHAAGWSSAGRQQLLAALAGIRPRPSPALQRVAATQVLRVGVTGDYAPFSVESGGTLSGADIELAQRLAEHLHAQPVFIRTSWRSLVQDLRADDFDLAMGGVSVTPERSAQGAFSIPYASGGKTILARCADASRYHDLE